MAKVARLLGENRHRLNQHRGYSEEVIFVISEEEISKSPMRIIHFSSHHDFAT